MVVRVVNQRRRGLAGSFHLQRYKDAAVRLTSRLRTVQLRLPRLSTLRFSTARMSTVGLTTALLAACATQTPSPEPPPLPASDTTRIELRLLQTTDLHAYMLGYDYYRNQATNDYGLAHTAALIGQARAQNPNHFLIDNGDLIQGSALGDWVAEQSDDYLQQVTHPVVDALNHLQYDVANIGNHEFDFGLEFLQTTMAGANFPVISANLFYADTPEQAGWQQADSAPPMGERRPIFEPYSIQARQLIDNQGQHHSIKVGFIGFVPPQIMNWNAGHLADQVAVYDIIEAANYFIPRMQEAGADVIVAVPHSGLQHFDTYPQFAEQVSVQLAKVEGIDAILFGHQHQVFPGASRYDGLAGVDNVRGRIHGIPAVQPGYWGSHLGIIDLTLAPVAGGWNVIDSDVQVPAIDSAQDPEVAQIVDAAHRSTQAWLDTPVITMQRPLRNYFAMAGPEYTVQLVNQAQLHHGYALQRLGLLPAELPILSAAAPFRNGGQGPNDYTSVSAGELTLGNIKDLYVYPNTVQVVKVNGAQLRDWLEMSARLYEHVAMRATEPEPLLATDVASFNFDIMAGVTYEIQPQHPPRFDAQGNLIAGHHHRVYNLRYQGELVSNDDEFLVVTNNYRASGGGNFPHLDGSNLVYSGEHEIRQLLLDYMSRLGEQYPAGYRPALIQNWYLVLPRGAQTYLRSSASPSAIEQSRRLRDIEFVDIDENGYGRYRILP